MRHSPASGFYHDQCGAILPVVAIFLGVLIGLGALAIDMTRGFASRDQLQASADAAALAGATIVFNQSAAQSEAVRFGNLNAPHAAGNVMSGGDIDFGTWDPDTKTFTLGGANPNAVQATAVMSQARGNGLQTALASFFGLTSVDVTAGAVATGDNGSQWDVVLVQDVTGSFSAELDDAKTADQTLLQCLNNRASGDSLIGTAVFTGFGQELTPLKPLGDEFQSTYDAIGGLKKCGSSGMPKCSGTHVGAGIDTAIGMFDVAYPPGGDDGDDDDDGGYPVAPPKKKAIVIVGDGEPNAKAYPQYSNNDLKVLANQSADLADSKDISVFTVFYNEGGSGSGTAFFEGLTRGDGDFHETPDPTLLTDLLLQICNSQLPLRLVR